VKKPFFITLFFPQAAFLIHANDKLTTLTLLHKTLLRLGKEEDCVFVSGKRTSLKITKSSSASMSCQPRFFFKSFFSHAHF